MFIKSTFFYTGLALIAIIMINSDTRSSYVLLFQYLMPL